LTVSFHASGMPPHILRLFEAPVALEVAGRVGRRRRREGLYTGVAEYVKYFGGGGGEGAVGAAGGLDGEAVAAGLRKRTVAELKGL